MPICPFKLPVDRIAYCQSVARCLNQMSLFFNLPCHHPPLSLLNRMIRSPSFIESSSVDCPSKSYMAVTVKGSVKYVTCYRVCCLLIYHIQLGLPLLLFPLQYARRLQEKLVSRAHISRLQLVYRQPPLPRTLLFLRS